MKEATGELNMTVITLIAIAAIAALFYIFVWPMIQRTIAQQTCQTYGTNYNAERAEDGACGDGCVTIEEADNEGEAETNERVSKWCCCKADGSGSSGTSTTGMLVK